MYDKQVDDRYKSEPYRSDLYLLCWFLGMAWQVYLQNLLFLQGFEPGRQVFPRAVFCRSSRSIG